MHQKIPSYKKIICSNFFLNSF
uniref:Uncharacterized protein n=1 Tax=Rhizophora mucronata TaxID=61149 RepID=A0A2P2R1A0_RHIMU